METNTTPKKCRHCDRDLSRSQFYVDRKRADGLTPYCRDYYADYYTKNRERQIATTRKNNIKRRYGLTVEAYDEMIAQGCSVCGCTEKIVMDHCHATNSLRAALCNGCNVALGAAKDNPETLRELANYLERHRDALPSTAAPL